MSGMLFSKGQALQSLILAARSIAAYLALGASSARLVLVHV